MYRYHKDVNGSTFFVDNFLYSLVVVGWCEQVVGGWRGFWHIRLVLVADNILDEGVEVICSI